MSSDVLDVTNLRDVYEALISVQHKWKDVGTMLGLESHRLDAIEMTAHRPQDALRETLKEWLKTDPAPSWEGILEALWTGVVDEPRLAQNIEERHCPRRPTLAQPTALALDTADLIRRLNQVTPAWYRFCIQLGLAKHKLDEIQVGVASGANHCTTCFSHALDYWVANGDDVSYESIALALENSEYRNLARTFRPT